MMRHTVTRQAVDLTKILKLTISGLPQCIDEKTEERPPKTKRTQTRVHCAGSARAQTRGERHDVRMLVTGAVLYATDAL